VKKLKEALLYEKEDVRILDVDIPKIGPNDILLNVKAAKICPTDVRKYTLGSGLPGSDKLCAETISLNKDFRANLSTKVSIHSYGDDDAIAKSKKSK